MNLTNIILLFALIIFMSVAGYIIKTESIKSYKINNDLPAFFATKYNITNVRSGPSTEYPIIYIYKYKFMPIKVIKEKDNWYAVEDINNQIGWIRKNLLLKKNTAITLQNNIGIYLQPSLKSKEIANIDKYNIVILSSCPNGTLFCKVEINNPNITPHKITGWILKSTLWGAHLNIKKKPQKIIYEY